MIASDTSTVVAYLEGNSGKDVEIFDQALAARQIVLPPVVLTELLSDAELSSEVVELVKGLPILEIVPGFWERAGLIRAKVLGKGFKARTADALIAQSCLDHKLGLLSRDNDFKAFSRLTGLVLIR